jgi:hypothetical protein
LAVASLLAGLAATGMASPGFVTVAGLNTAERSVTVLAGDVLQAGAVASTEAADFTVNTFKTFA